MSGSSTSTVRIGINPLTWTNDDMPELGADTPLEVCLKEAREAGYAGIELGNKFPREVNPLREVLSKFDLALVSGWYSSALLERPLDAEKKAIEAHAHLLSELGSNVLILAETSRAVHGDRRTPISRRPRLEDKEWTPLARSLTELGQHLASRGLSLAYHHHMGTVVETEEEIDRLMSSTGPAVKLLLDTGHLTFAGGDPLRVISKWGSRIAHVHLKDIRKKVLARVLEEDLSFLEAVLQGVFTVPGDGSIDYDAVLGALAAANYRGWLVVEAEQDPAVAHPLTYAKMGYENVASMAVGAGMIVPELRC